MPGEILDGLEFFTTGPGVVLQTSRDVLTVLDSASRGILDYGANTGGTAAVRRGYIVDTSRAIVVGFGLEGIYTAQTRRDVVQRFVGYLEGSVVTAVGEPPVPGIPGEFRIVGNYPNPFNPSTSIVFEVPSRTKVALGVYNVLGQALADIFKGFTDPGRHVVQWDASGYPGGVYFYRLTAPGLTLTGKILLVR